MSQTLNLRIHAECSTQFSCRSETFAMLFFNTDSCGTDIFVVTWRRWFETPSRLLWRHCNCIYTRVNIWNVNCVRTTTFVFDSRTGVLVGVPKFSKGSRTPNLRINAECSNQVSYTRVIVSPITGNSIVCSAALMAPCGRNLPVTGGSHNGSVHYIDLIMGVMASQITNLTIVYSTAYSGADQRKHQSSKPLAFVWKIHRWPVNSPHKGPVTRKMFAFDDVTMASCHDVMVLSLKTKDRQFETFVVISDDKFIKFTIFVFPGMWFDSIYLEFAHLGDSPDDLIHADKCREDLAEPLSWTARAVPAPRRC